MDTILTNPQMVVEDRQRHLFRVSRRAFTDQSVLEAENRNIFDRCWLYLGHSSEIANNCDFITRNVGGRELIFNRDRGGAVHAFLNTCPHRGAMVVREKKGNARQLPLLLSRLVVQRERPLRVALRGRQLRPRALRRRLRRPGAGAAAREPSRFLVRELRQECRVAVATIWPAPRSIIDIVVDDAEAGMEIVGLRPASTASTPTGSCWPRTASTATTAVPTHATYFKYLMTIGTWHGAGAGASAPSGMRDSATATR